MVQDLFKVKNKIYYKLNIFQINEDRIYSVFIYLEYLDSFNMFCCTYKRVDGIMMFKDKYI